MDYLAKLNVPQREAAAHTTGPLLIIAGAGAGKTRTIAYRILHLVKTGIDPHKILAITFTNKAAAEMRERVKDLADYPERIGFPFFATFHGLGAYILREEAATLDLSKYFTIYDRDQSESVIKKILKSLDLANQFEVGKILGAISRAKGDGLNRKSYEEKFGSDFFRRTVNRVWEKYDFELHQAKALDFDDLLLKTVELWVNRPDILAKYQNRWQYIHIDEYQDTNAVQYRMAEMLALQHKNICVVGDTDQSIYGWRGADFTNLLNFEEDYPEAKIVLLEENYRSTQNILAAANAIIKENKKRHTKNLFTKNEAGERLSLFVGLNEKEEAEFIANQIKIILEEGVPAKEVAVMYRANFQSRILEEVMLLASLPYQLIGTRFYDRKEIKDALAHLQAALNPNDFGSFTRALGATDRGKGVGKVTLAKIAAGQEVSLPETIRKRVADFRNFLDEIRKKSGEMKPAELILWLIKKSGLEEECEKDSERGEDRLENLKELVSLASRYDEFGPEEGLIKMITDTSLISDQDTIKGEGVKLMTVHAAKGLEFDYVFVTGLEQGLFPHDGFGEKKDEEEERRLFYVALTRARKKLFLSYAQMRTLYGSTTVNTPSEFLLNLDDELLEAAEAPVRYAD